MRKGGILMQEIWKAVRGYEGFYQVSNEGRIRGVDRIVRSKGSGTRQYYGQILSTPVASNGYNIVTLYNNTGKRISASVHRIILDAFQPNNDPNLECNHINGNKNDNRLKNLEWVTHSENKLHAFATGLQKPVSEPFKKPVIRDDGAVFPSAKEAGEAIGGFGSMVSMVCRGVRNKYKGYGFRYIGGA